MITAIEGRPSTHWAGSRRPRCACCRTTSTPRLPSTPMTRRLRRHGQGRSRLAELSRDRALARRPQGRRDAPRAVRQARRRYADPRVGAARASRELQPRAGDWANWDEFRRLEQLGLTMYGQMTAGSWIYIGTQGILQGTYETFAAVAAKRFGGTLAGTITLTAGLGGMGGAQPLAVTMNDGVAICVDVDASPHRAAHRARVPRRSREDPRARARACVRGAGCPQGVVYRSARQRGIRRPRTCSQLGAEIDIVTDQTSAHDPLAYLPLGVEFDDWAEREEGPGLRAARSREHGRARRGDGGVSNCGRRGLRLRQQHPH